MKKTIAAAFLILLAACAHKPGGEQVLATQPRIPDLPVNLGAKAGPLPPLVDPSMGAQQIDAINTDIRYNAIAYQLNRVIDVYNCVKEAFNNNKDMGFCDLEP